MIKQILKGHISEDTAYLVEDYPYGFRLRCKIRYWLEFNPRLGTRLVSQTSNPKISSQLVWNKPKKSTYSLIAGCMYLDENDYVTWSGLTEYSNLEESKEWLETYREGLTEDLIRRCETWISKKEKYEQLKAEGKINFNYKLVKEN